MQSVTGFFSKILQKSALLLRGLGLEYVNTLSRGCLARSDALEQPKKVLSGSIWHATGRNVVHMLPLTVLAGLIWLNYCDYFIGPTFIEDADKDNYFMAGIQLCAKLEELLCVASLSAIVLQALRDQLLGDGVPIGLLGSGVWFSSLSAFWSADFLGSCNWTVCECRRTSWRQIWRRCRFYLLLISCGAIAVTIGPASAILMIPRQQDMFAGGLSFYLNGTYSDFWPNTVYAHTELDLCSSVNATEYSVCASGGYSSMLETWSAFEYDQYCPRTGGLAQYAPSCQARGVDGNREWDNFVIHNKNSLMPSVVSAVRGGTWSSRGFAAVQPHAATVAITQQKKAEWYDKVQDKSWNHPNTRQFRWTYDTATLGHAISPFVRVRCTEPQNLTADADSALFPFIANRSDVATSAQSPRQRPTTDWDPQWKQANISQLDHSRSVYLRTQWLPLPMQGFGHPSTGLMTAGLLLELPWNGTSRAAVGCAVAAAWHNVTVSSRRSANYDAWNVALSPNDYLDMDDSPDSVGTNTPVGLDMSWLVQLTPAAPVTALTPADYTYNTLEALLISTRYDKVVADKRSSGRCFDFDFMAGNREYTDTELWANKGCIFNTIPMLSAVLAMFVADGLSRYQSHRIYNIPEDLSRRVWPMRNASTFNESRIFATWLDERAVNHTAEPDRVAAWMAMYANGYAYYPSKNSEYFALAGVSIYMALVLSHMVYSLTRKKGTSNAWNSVTEMLVLCQNSPPPATSHKLDNTSAGISQLRTYSTVVRVRAFPPQDGVGNHRLGLVLLDDSVSHELGRVDVMEPKSGGSSVSGKGVTVNVTDIEMGSIAPTTTTSDATTLAGSRLHLHNTLRQSGLRVVEMDEKYA